MIKSHLVVLVMILRLACLTFYWWELLTGPLLLLWWNKQLGVLRLERHLNLLFWYLERILVARIFNMLLNDVGVKADQSFSFDKILTGKEV
jgi:hypothetical protein